MVDESTGGVLQRDALIGLKSYWKRKLIEYTTGLPDYLGCHYSPNASEDDVGWAIWQFTWTGTDCTDIQGPITGSWTNRATLDWI